MPIPVTCGCGASYSLKEEYAGQTLRCQKCGAALQVGQPGERIPPRAAELDSEFRRNRFLLRQKHLAISEKYYVHDEQGQRIMFIHRPAHMARRLLAIFGAIFAVVVWLLLVFGLAGLASEVLSEGVGIAIVVLGFLGLFPVAIAVGIALSAKRHVTFYRDDSKVEKLLEVLQDRKFYFLTATYTVLDTGGLLLARLRKNYLHDIFRKRWYCVDHHGRELCVAKEDSVILSLLRRVLGPFYGLLRTNFVIFRGDQIIGEFNRKFTVLDRYVLDLSADPGYTLDRRIALALGVMLDTGERR